MNPAALAAIRERSGFTQSALAQCSGVSQARISELEHGGRNGSAVAVRPTTVRALAEALQVPILALVAVVDPG